VVDANLAAAWLPDRPADSHKGTFGTCLIAAGSINYCGAALLASQAAYRVGAGLVRTAIPGAIYDALAGSLPETTWLILPHTLGVLNAEGARIVGQNLERVSCMLLGPGWGLEEETLAFLKQLFGDSGAGNQMGFDMVQGKRARNESVNLPHLVIDADALKLLARIDHWEKKIGFAVLTPHPGEMAVLTGLPVEKIQADREEIACEYAAKWGQVVVLKGALTIIAAPDGRRALIPVANSALAKAGTGDVLAGMIAGYVAQGVEAFNAAALAAWLHARAGVAAARRIGTPAAVAAGDLIAAIPLVIKQIGG
jgi:NAD(P)H-hydrate epimerase